jgi:hypothetical protein
LGLNWLGWLQRASFWSLLQLVKCVTQHANSYCSCAHCSCGRKKTIPSIILHLVTPVKWDYHCREARAKTMKVKKVFLVNLARAAERQIISSENKQITHKIPCYPADRLRVFSV